MLYDMILDCTMLLYLVPRFAEALADAASVASLMTTTEAALRDTFPLKQ